GINTEMDPAMGTHGHRHEEGTASPPLPTPPMTPLQEPKTTHPTLLLCHYLPKYNLFLPLLHQPMHCPHLLNRPHPPAAASSDRSSHQPPATALDSIVLIGIIPLPATPQSPTPLSPSAEPSPLPSTPASEAASQAQARAQSQAHRQPALPSKVPVLRAK
ncbi:hypothetical protein H0H81_002070, partial [Sphagnurus paluster]